jgi:hypothetical protein
MAADDGIDTVRPDGSHREIHSDIKVVRWIEVHSDVVKVWLLDKTPRHAKVGRHV